jgi:hypothetical protein
MRAIEFILADEAERQEGEAEKQLLKNASSEIIGLRNRLAAAFRRNRKLEALEEAGVDNWEGYDEAMRSLHEEEEFDE